MEEFKKAERKPTFINNTATSAQLVVLMVSEDPEVDQFRPLIEKRLYAITPWKIMTQIMLEVIVPIQNQLAALKAENTELRLRLAAVEELKSRPDGPTVRMWDDKIRVVDFGNLGRTEKPTNDNIKVCIVGSGLPGRPWNIQRSRETATQMILRDLLDKELDIDDDLDNDDEGQD
jgi:hypothetical protein